MPDQNVAEFPRARKQHGTISPKYEDFCASRGQLLVASLRVSTSKKQGKTNG